jgi:hypothetical protein
MSHTVEDTIFLLEQNASITDGLHADNLDIHSSERSHLGTNSGSLTISEAFHAQIIRVIHEVRYRKGK